MSEPNSTAYSVCPLKIGDEVRFRSISGPSTMLVVDHDAEGKIVTVSWPTRGGNAAEMLMPVSRLQIVRAC